MKLFGILYDEAVGLFRMAEATEAGIELLNTMNEEEAEKARRNWLPWSDPMAMSEMIDRIGRATVVSDSTKGS